jgi:outer membrane protein OmpA-like peptidoglycan-associated protein
VVTAVSDVRGDYESLKKVTAVDENRVHLHYSANAPPQADPMHPPDPNAPADANKLVKTECDRTIDGADLQNAHAYSELFCGTTAAHQPGTTAISTSTDVLTQLRAGEDVSFQYSLGNAFNILENMGRVLTGPGALFVNPKSNLSMLACVLHRVEDTDLAAPVLLDGRPTLLPALHASCQTAHGKSHFYFLDHPGNPITLAFQGGSLGARLQVIQLQQGAPASERKEQLGAGGGGTDAERQQRDTMEQRLQDKKPVDVYGIYFDFDSATIRPESQTVLKEISAMLHEHPDWKLQLAGNTDNIGTADFNLELSQRRAAAVKDALLSRYGIAADRLTTTGYGASRPVDSNATLEGRARNRRVELQRQ